jgi:hypothetical protein
MATKTTALVLKGHEIYRRKVIDEGRTLFDRKRRQRFTKDAPPLIDRGAGRKRKMVYLASYEEARTFIPGDGGESVEVVGRTVRQPSEGQVVQLKDADGKARGFKVTPEFLAELTESSDLEAANRLMKKAAHGVEILLGMGCGFALASMVFLALHANGKF